MRIVVVGAGAVGSRAARQLASSVEVTQVVVCDRTVAKAASVAAALGPRAVAREWSPDVLEGAAAMVVASGRNVAAVRSAIRRGVHVASSVDDTAEVQDLLALDAAARHRGASVVVGAAMAPGLTCVLARFAAARFSDVEEIHVAKAGTGGPACARQHHRALSDEALDWRDGGWRRRPGGSGRELCWFPDPVRGLDCYRAGAPDALLLAPAFSGVRRVTARIAASRRDRFTAALPMLRPPHPEGEVGAVRVEVRGLRATHREVEILGAIDRPAVAAGAVVAQAALWAGQQRLARAGCAGLAELVSEPVQFLAELAGRGVKAAVFEGSNC